LDIRFIGTGDLSPLSGLKKLEVLWLGPFGVVPIPSDREVFQREEFPAKITDISPIADLKNLKEICLDSCDITEVSSMSGLNKLEKLSLRDNTIVDISALANLKNLRELSLEDNRISDISPIAK